MGATMGRILSPTQPITLRVLQCAACLEAIDLDMPINGHKDCLDEEGALPVSEEIMDEILVGPSENWEAED